MMFKVTIVETLSKIIDVEAGSIDEATAEVRAKYNDGEIVLGYEDFDDVEFITFED